MIKYPFILKYLLLSILILFFNCITAYSKYKLSNKTEMTMTSPEKILTIQESENFVKISWVEIQTLKIEENYEKISESKVLRSACIKKPNDSSKKIIEVLDYDNCPTREKFTQMNIQKNSELDDSIYSLENQTFYKIPSRKYKMEGSYINNLMEDKTEKKISFKVFADNGLQRIYLKPIEGKLLVYDETRVWKNDKYFQNYSLKNWNGSGDYMLKNSKGLQKIDIKNSVQTVLIFKSYQNNQTTNRMELVTEYFHLSLSDETWKNKTIHFANYEIVRNQKFSFYPFLVPITIPLDIVTAPAQLIYFSFYEYAMIVSCTLGFTCKTALG
ncbi:MAG: hypothetical protein SFU98_20420 [Leptospiraceae bacterium]|nr:hypothetical protein [Leptospiraceae bacterium]